MCSWHTECIHECECASVQGHPPSLHTHKRKHTLQDTPHVHNIDLTMHTQTRTHVRTHTQSHTFPHP